MDAHVGEAREEEGEAARRRQRRASEIERGGELAHDVEVAGAIDGELDQTETARTRTFGPEIPPRPAMHHGGRKGSEEHRRPACSAREFATAEVDPIRKRTDDIDP